MMLLKKEGTWTVVTSGGGAISLKDLMEQDLSRQTGQALLQQIGQ